MGNAHPRMGAVYQDGHGREGTLRRGEEDGGEGNGDWDRMELMFPLPRGYRTALTALHIKYFSSQRTLSTSRLEGFSPSLCVCARRGLRARDEVHYSIPFAPLPGTTFGPLTGGIRVCMRWLGRNTHSRDYG